MTKVEMIWRFRFDICLVPGTGICLWNRLTWTRSWRWDRAFPHTFISSCDSKSPFHLVLLSRPSRSESLIGGSPPSCLDTVRLMITTQMPVQTAGWSRWESQCCAWMLQTMFSHPATVSVSSGYTLWHEVTFFFRLVSFTLSNLSCPTDNLELRQYKS